MYSLYDEQNGKKLYIASYCDKFNAEVEANHIQCDNPKWNVVVVEEDETLLCYGRHPGYLGL